MAIVSGFLIAGEVGKLIQFSQLGTDISTATALTIVASPPSGGTPLQLSASYVNDPVLGEIAQYSTTGNDFTTAGTWTLQLWVQFGSTKLFKAVEQQIQVYPSL
jgi:hypothetical protein